MPLELLRALAADLKALKRFAANDGAEDGDEDDGGGGGAAHRRRAPPTREELVASFTGAAAEARLSTKGRVTLKEACSALSRSTSR